MIEWRAGGGIRRDRARHGNSEMCGLAQQVDIAILFACLQPANFGQFCVGPGRMYIMPVVQAYTYVGQRRNTSVLRHRT